MKILTFSLFFMSLACFGQENFEKSLDSITSTNEAQAFIQANKKIKGKLFTFNKEKHKTRLAEDLFKLPQGGKKVVKSDYKTTYYKIVEKTKIPHNRVHYILFDSSKIPLKEINEKRNDILDKYQKGYDFKVLAKYYSMDINANKGGDTGWFIDSMMPSTFESAIKSHNLNDIFTLDISEDNEYYVILKSHEPKAIEEITVVKFSESKK